MKVVDLKAAFDGMQREAFRLEQLQSYGGVPGPEWEAWKAGKPFPVITAENNPWLKRVARHIAAGRRVYQVSIIEWPLTDYRRYELAGWPMSAAVGTEYYLVDREAHSDLAELTEDFWMYDEQRVAVMRYDEQERFIGAEDPIESIETYIARRDLAMKYAVPLEQWMVEHRDRLAD